MRQACDHENRFCRLQRKIARENLVVSRDLQLHHERRRRPRRPTRIEEFLVKNEGGVFALGYQRGVCQAFPSSRVIDEIVKQEALIATPSEIVLVGQRKGCPVVGRPIT